MKHIALATYEFHPVTPGGAGVVIGAAVRSLAREGFHCTLVCDLPKYERFLVSKLLEKDDLTPGRVDVVGVAGNEPHRTSLAGCIYEAKSDAFARALIQLHDETAIDLIEFPEYAGVALSTLQAKLANRSLQNVPIALRIHGGLELIDRAENAVDLPPDRLQMYRMERLALRMADYVLAPSWSIGKWYQDLYMLSNNAVLVSTPPVPFLTRDLRRNEGPVDPGHFIFYGRLQEVKGCDLFAEAAVSILAEAPGKGWRFTFVGSDTPCAAHRRPVSSCLRVIIPGRFRYSVEFLPAIGRAQIAEIVRTAAAAVVPSKFESFCLSAHELRSLGLPLIVSDIPAFWDFFSEETGALRFDRTALGLRKAILRMREEPRLASRLARQPLPRYGSFVSAYRELVERAGS